MTRHQRLRRVAIVCCTFTRNLAYFRSGRDNGLITFPKGSNIHVTINGNFLDMAVIEWRKLFHPKEEHSWQKIVTDPIAFEAALLTRIQTDQAGYNQFYKQALGYRDKFVAHLDSEMTMTPPFMDVAKASVECYYEHLLKHEIDKTDAYDPADLTAYYDRCREGLGFYTEFARKSELA